MASTGPPVEGTVEGYNDAVARVDGVDIEARGGFVIDVEYDVTIDFGVRMVLGVEIGFDEKTDCDETGDVDVKNEAGASMGVVSHVAGVVTEIAVDVTLVGDCVREIIVEVGA
jgi:hypothetical protein